MGYYDINGYNGLRYDNLVPGGKAELQTFNNPGWSALANNVIASQGHVHDFYSGGYGASGDDIKPPYNSFNSLADFMGTSQDSVSNSNGSTTFWFFTNGAKLFASDAKSSGVWKSDRMYGMSGYFNYAGYGTGDPATNYFYTELTDNMGKQYGFTFADYMAEIDAGRVVIIHIEGHSMLGYGYDASNHLVYLHDTWSLDQHSMTWGGSYDHLSLWGVTVMEPTGGTPIPVQFGVWS